MNRAHDVLARADSDVQRTRIGSGVAPLVQRDVPGTHRSSAPGHP